MSIAIFLLGVILAAALLGRIIKQQHLAMEQREREYFKTQASSKDADAG